jgi:hypothetical protein
MKCVSKSALAAAIAAASLSLSPSSSLAQSPNTGGLSFAGGVDLASSYYFRGYLQENAGFIIQPYFGVAFKVAETDDFTAGISLSTWNSIHTENTGSDGDGAGAWYENDLYGSVPISFGKFTITPAYYLYQYPNGSFESTQEAVLTVAYDDSDLWGGDNAEEGFKLAPYVTFAYEFADGNGSEDFYFEAGVTPGYTINAGAYSIPLTFPIAFGFSFDDYYLDSDGDNSFFGYGSAGVATSIPLPLPESYGSWSVNLGGYYNILFADSVEIANNDSSHVFWGKVGVSFTY